jgi:hypothetical protein
MISEEQFWRLDPIAKAQAVVADIDRMVRRARAADLGVTAYILELAAIEARKGPDGSSNPSGPAAALEHASRPLSTQS